MNVIITNKQKQLIANLDIDIIKAIEGEYETDELVSMFANFYFGKMIIDITAIKNYHDIKNMQKLSMTLDMNKVVVLLPPEDAEVTSNAFLSKLVSMGVYNFTTDLNGLQYLLNTPNTYKDVAHVQQLQQPDEQTETLTGVKRDSYVVGFKNLTEHAGATTLVVLLHRELIKQNVSTAAIELNKRDFIYFQDKELISTNSDHFPAELVKQKHTKVILVDLNDSNHEGLCNEVIYLLEPSIIRLNKLMRRDKRAFEKIKNSKLILNMSLLNSTDISDFEFESKTKVFYNLAPLNDRARNKEIVNLLGTLGLLKTEVAGKREKSNKLKDFIDSFR